MSLLTACQNVVKETGIGAVPATIISNTEASAVQLNALAERSAKVLMRHDWQAMIREQTISTVASTETYSLPSDWDRYITETFWDSTNYWQMRGQLSPQAWQEYKRSIVSAPTSRKSFRVRANLVYIFPTPSAVESLITEYIRNTPWINGSTYRVAATNDADTTVFPERLLEFELKWRWLEAKGMSYGEAKAEAEEQVSVALAHDAPAPTIDYSGAPQRLAVNVPSQIV